MLVFFRTFKIVMLPTRPNTLLAICSSLQFPQHTHRIRLPQENRFKLIHSSISEEESRVGEGHDGGRRLEGVGVLGLEVVDEGFTDVVGGPF